MSRNHRRYAAAAACGAVLAVGAGLAQPAAAQSPGVVFYTGAHQTGTATSVDLTSTGCHNLAAPSASALNYAAVDVDVFFNADCRTGAPGDGGDLSFALGSLHTADFPYQAVSYRVRPIR
ncbi:hypothetical protein ACFUJY_26465 [Streptomyces sp. NPDC057249]|uniref:hypothetical protein n=1 Tax=Streptomyces sp. NPDC057249 TaxID=3346067 RepID=UPI00363240D7